MEIWKDIEGYEWLYQVSNQARVKSLNYRRTGKEQILKNRVKTGWYQWVLLCNNWKNSNFMNHRLFAIAFIPNPENKPFINHKNWIASDNTIENLEWCTQSENIQHAWDNGLSKVSNNNYFYTNHPTRWKFWKNCIFSKKVNQYSLQWEFIKTWDSAMDIKRSLWISSISQCCNWKRKTAGWFIWKFK
jgi:hypothetical protein